MAQTIDERARELLAKHGGLPKGAISALAEALTRIEELEAENKDLKSGVVAFGAVHAVRHARDYGLPEGHLEAVHYDILSRAGARMVDFKRHDSAPLTKGIKE